MKYHVHYDITGEWFEVEGKTLDECKHKAETERERRGWSDLEVWSERVDRVEVER